MVGLGSSERLRRNFTRVVGTHRKHLPLHPPGPTRTGLA